MIQSEDKNDSTAQICIVGRRVTAVDLAPALAEQVRATFPSLLRS